MKLLFLQTPLHANGKTVWMAILSSKITDDEYLANI